MAPARSGTCRNVHALRWWRPYGSRSTLLHRAQLCTREHAPHAPVRVRALMQQGGRLDEGSTHMRRSALKPSGCDSMFDIARSVVRICTGTHRCHICTETRLAPPTSAPGLGSALPHPHQDWSGLTSATRALRLGSRFPLLHREWGHWGHPSNICTGSGDTGDTPATSAPGWGAAHHLAHELGVARKLHCLTESLHAERYPINYRTRPVRVRVRACARACVCVRV